MGIKSEHSLRHTQGRGINSEHSLSHTYTHKGGGIRMSIVWVTHVHTRKEGLRMSIVGVTHVHIHKGGGLRVSIV